MEIRIETSSYNERRYGKPWIAVVDFSSSAKGDYQWGDWAGDHRNGGSGVLSIEASHGDIIARGQKDFRKPRNSAPEFYAVTTDGQLEEIGDKGEAYKYYLDHKEAAPDLVELRAERDRLVARIVEIDALLEA